MRLRSEEATLRRPMTGARTRPLWPCSLIALYRAFLVYLRAMQLDADQLCAIVVLFIESHLPSIQGPKGCN